mgnify:CR=1 FL=1
MKIYLDTANVKEIHEAASFGLLDGVTTNPSLVVKEGRSFREMLQEVCKIVDGPISAEVVSMEADAMVKEGKELAKIHKNIVVKVPLIAEAPGGRGNQSERDPLFFTDTGAVSGQSWRLVRLAVYRTARRHQLKRHGAHPTDLNDL